MNNCQNSEYVTMAFISKHVFEQRVGKSLFDISCPFIHSTMFLLHLSDILLVFFLTYLQCAIIDISIFNEKCYNVLQNPTLM